MAYRKWRMALVFEADARHNPQAITRKTRAALGSEVTIVELREVRPDNEREPASEHLRNALQVLQAEITLQTQDDKTSIKSYAQQIATLTGVRDRVQAALDLISLVKEEVSMGGALHVGFLIRTRL